MSAFRLYRPADRPNPRRRRGLGVEHLETRRLLAAGPPTPSGAALLLLDRESVATSSVLREEGAAPPRLLAPLAVAPPGAALGTEPCIGDYSGDGLDDLAWRAVDGRVWVSVAGASPGWAAPQRW